jgi:hypothetical protein
MSSYYTYHAVSIRRPRCLREGVVDIEIVWSRKVGRARIDARAQD